MTETWTLTQLNIKGLKNKKHELLELAEKVNADVICLNEANSIDIKLDKYNCAAKTKIPGKMNGTGTLIYVQNTCSYKTTRKEAIPNKGVVEIETSMAIITNIYGISRKEAEVDLK